MTNLTKLANQIITLRMGDAQTPQNGVISQKSDDPLHLTYEAVPISKAVLIQKIGSRHTGPEYETIQKMHDLALGLGAECYPLRRKAGARHSHADQRQIQRMHDDCTGLGATCKALPSDEVYSRQVFKNWENSTASQRKGRDAVNNAIKAGKLAKAKTKTCFRCRKRQAEEYHHINGYSEQKKLQVRPVCSKCHSALDPNYKALVEDIEIADTPKQGGTFSAVAYDRLLAKGDIKPNHVGEIIKGYLTVKAQADAPNYAPASTPQRCANCKHFRGDPGEDWCDLFDFVADQDYVCNGWAAQRPDEIPGYVANKADLAALVKGILILRGGGTSGNFAHAGRKGKRGGSGKGGGFKRIGVKPGASKKQVKRAAKKAKESGAKTTSDSKPQAKPKSTAKKVAAKKPLVKAKPTAQVKAKESDFNTGSKKLDDILSQAGGASKADFNNHLMGKMMNGEIDMKEAQTLNAHYGKAKTPKKKTREEIKAAEKSWEVEGNSAHKSLVSDTKNWHNGLSTAENAALVSYSGNDYQVINSNLRKGKKGSKADTIKSIDAALEKSALKKGLTVYRGVGADDLGKLLGSDNPADWAGKGFQDKGYMSTSVSRSGSFPGVTLEMRLPKGTKGGYLGNLKGGKHSGKDGGEKEFLIPRGKKVVIKKIVWGETGFDGKEGVEKVIAELVDE